MLQLCCKYLQLSDRNHNVALIQCAIFSPLTQQLVFVIFMAAVFAIQLHVNKHANPLINA